jgi:Ca2+-binding EF-hand superfamily protein
MLRKEARITESEIDELLGLLDPKNAGTIPSAAYMDAVYTPASHFSKAMCSYLATDLNGDNVIQPNELRSLLWLTEGVEPTKARVDRELKAMDINSDGSISMVEWIKYLASIDPVVRPRDGAE